LLRYFLLLRRSRKEAATHLGKMRSTFSKPPSPAPSPADSRWSKRVLAGVLFGVGMAIAAVNFLTWLFPGN